MLVHARARVYKRFREFTRNLRGVRKAPGFTPTVVGAAAAAAAVVWSQLQPQFDSAWGALLGGGVSTLAVGVNELAKFYASTARLKLEEKFEVFDEKSVRLVVAARNEGNVLVKNAKAVLDILEPEPEKLRRHLCEDAIFLANRNYPAVEGELLPWALPENPIPRYTVAKIEPDWSYWRVVIESIDYTHITSIAPRQSAHIIVLDAKRVGEGGKAWWRVLIYSEYGAPGPEDIVKRYPRLCVKLGDGLERLKLGVTVYGEGLREPEQIEVEVTPEKLDSVARGARSAGSGTA